MRMLYFLLQKEFILILRDKTILSLLFLITVIFLVVLPRSARINLGVVPLSIVDHDQTESSERFLHKLTNVSCFKLGGYEDSYEMAIRKVEIGDTEGVVEIPDGFEACLQEGKEVEVFVEFDATNSVLAGLSSFYFLQILQQYSLECLNERGYLLNAPLNFMQVNGNKFKMNNSRESNSLVEIPDIKNTGALHTSMIELETSKRYNPDGKSRKYQMGAIIAILVCLVGTVFAALNVVTEKESGTIEQVNVTPVRKSLFILSKLIPCWLIGMFVLSLGLFLSWVLYGVLPDGSLGGIYIVSFIFLIAITGFGVLLSTACANQQHVMLLCFFFLLIICLLCGMWTPIGSMPYWARLIADINPLRYYVEALRLFFAYGSDLADVKLHVGAIVIFAVLFNVSAICNFRKSY